MIGEPAVRQVAPFLDQFSGLTEGERADLVGAGCRRQHEGAAAKAALMSVTEVRPSGRGSARGARWGARLA
jgi:hypothetical protein